MMQKEHFTRITADEINCLIYSYFVDSGMKHSAFTLNAEARLEHSPFFRKHIRRGELVELLIKALLYVEVESHWNQSALSLGCKAGFSLLEPHVCSLSPPPAIPVPGTNQKPDNDAGFKRKSSSPTENGRNGKRPRVDAESSQTEEQTALQTSAKVPRAITGAQSSKPAPPLPSPQDPIYLLKRSSAEVRPVFVCSWNPVHHNLVAYGSKDSRVTIYDLPETIDSIDSLEPAIILEGLSTQEKSDVTCLHWSPDGNLLAVATCDGNIRVFTVKGELYLNEPQHDVPMFALRFSTDGRYLVSASLDGTSALWDVKEKRLIHVYKNHSDCVLNVSWLDNTHFLSAGADKDAYIYDVRSPNTLHCFHGHMDEINMVTANPSRTKIATCSDDRTVRIWSLASVLGDDDAPGLSPPPTILVGHTHAVVVHEWCPAGVQDGVELIATASFDGQSRLWDAQSGACLYMFKEGERPVFALSICPSGLFFATGSADGKFTVYNTKTGKRAYSWRSQKDHPGLFEIDWQQSGKRDRIALALEMGQLAVIDATRISELR